jgi:hypothetical protein
MRCFDGRKRKHDAADIMVRIVAKRLVERVERSGFVVMKRPPAIGAAALGRGYEDAQGSEVASSCLPRATMHGASSGNRR